MRIERSNGEIVRRGDGRDWIKIDNKWIPNNIFVAKQNPDICGTWYEGCEVHHIDGDRTNDDPNNLICLSKEEHHRIHKDWNMTHGIIVEAYKDGKLYNTYPTLKKCTQDIGVPVFYISMYLKHKTILNGQKFKIQDWDFKQLGNTLKQY